LSPQQRLQSMLEVFETGMMLIRQSPKRQLLDQMYLKREDQWRRIQQELFARAQ